MQRWTINKYGKAHLIQYSIEARQVKNTNIHTFQLHLETHIYICMYKHTRYHLSK
jgi:hypothetical protein